jgi:hypothetical protein
VSDASDRTSGLLTAHYRHHDRTRPDKRRSRVPSGRKDKAMNADRERQLLAAARDLADTGDLAEEVTAILGGARAARLDPDALPGLAGAALALGAASLQVYRAEDPRYADDSDLLADIADAEDGIAGHLAAAARLEAGAHAAAEDAESDLHHARVALATAMAMSTGRPCTGCHAARAAAVAVARARIGACTERADLAGDALGILGPLAARLRRALALVRAVPADLGETYQAVYELRHRGGVMPADGDWLTGQPPAAS